MLTPRSSPRSRPPDSKNEFIIRQRGFRWLDTSPSWHRISFQTRGKIPGNPRFKCREFLLDLFRLPLPSPHLLCPAAFGILFIIAYSYPLFLFLILWDSMGFYGILWDSMGFYEILWDSMGFQMKHDLVLDPIDSRKCSKTIVFCFFQSLKASLNPW